MSHHEQFNLKENNTLDLKKLSKDREERAKLILNKAKPQIINENTYLVPSSNLKYKYKVTHIDSWTCECKDFEVRCKNNGLFCKHIKSIQFFLKLKNKTEMDNLIVNEIKKECIYCKSSNIIKRGIRFTKRGKVQRFSCNACKKRFILEPIKYVQISAEKICLVMDLYFKGLSLRDIEDTLQQFYNLKVSYESIRQYISKFSQLMNNYVNKETKDKLKLSGKWQADEQTVQVGKEKLWNWNVIDTETRYLIANNISKSRYYDDTVKIIDKAKEVGGRPEEIKTDGLRAYPKSIQQVYDLGKLQNPYTMHIKSKGFKDKENTNLIERYHNEWRDFDKVRRGFDNMETAQTWNDGYRLFHNAIRKHTALNGLTPLQKAKVDLGLENNRWLSLLLKSLSLTNKEK